jgi:hypothetical protein
MASMKLKILSEFEVRMPSGIRVADAIDGDSRILKVGLVDTSLLPKMEIDNFVLISKYDVRGTTDDVPFVKLAPGSKVTIFYALDMSLTHYANCQLNEVGP